MPQFYLYLSHLGRSNKQTFYCLDAISRDDAVTEAMTIIQNDELFQHTDDPVEAAMVVESARDLTGFCDELFRARVGAAQ